MRGELQGLKLLLLGQFYVAPEGATHKALVVRRATSYWLIRESRYCFMMGQVKMPDIGG